MTRKSSIDAQVERERRQTECVCINLRQMSRVVSQIYDDALAPAGLKITQFCLLRAIGRLEPASVTALAEDQELDRTTLTRNLALLERDGLIEQSTGADKRKSLAQLTRAGGAAIARALPYWEQVQRELRRSLGAQTLAQLSELREKISAAAKQSAA
jgi:DNA-binding MarR family transcriptional regulator